MKKTKIIIPALGILLLSTAASVTGTVAWFSSNSQVTATGMVVSANTDSNFLIIHGTDNANPQFDGSKISTTFTSEATAQLLPVAPAVELTKTNIDTAASWHFAYSTNPNDADEGVTDSSYQAVPQLDGYVAIETFAIGLTGSSATSSSAKNLRLVSVTLPAQAGISCVVRIDGADFLETYTEAEPLTAAEDLGIKATKDGTFVRVYYFINGEDSHVWSNNAANLTGSISFVFDINGAQ